jgi:protein ImuB
MKKPLLLSLYLPLLPLETLRPSWSEPGEYAVMDREQVLIASPRAVLAGVRVGMRCGGVATIAPGAVLLDRQSEKEARALDAIALAMMRFTPDVAFTENFSMLLDVGPSLRLFGGPLALCRHVRDSVRRLGFTAHIGAAPTAQGAWLLAHTSSARRPPHRRCLQLATLTPRLDRLPCAIVPVAEPFLGWFDGIGATDLGALRRLPRTGLLRRTSKQLLQALDCAYGDVDEMQRWIAVPAHFSAHVETFDRIEHAEALMHGATALILQLTGWLTAHQLAVLTFTLLMEHERGRAAVAPTPLEITLAEPAWKEPHLLRLLKERLAKIELSAPVIGLRLEAGQLQPMQPLTDQLFPEPGGSPADFKRLLELLSARLGPENVLTPVDHADHRPEQCNSWGPATSNFNKSASDDEALERPCWVLPKPIPLLMRQERPFYGSPLKLIRGPERLEAGWWDDMTVARDYYVAQGSDATCYWIYLERTQNARWFLHGLYA